MVKRINPCFKITVLILLILALSVAPIRVRGEVKPITEMENKLQGISEEEKAVLEKLFAIAQEMEEILREETVISEAIDTLQVQIKDLEQGIKKKQVDYNLQLDILEQVLVKYQRGGPATYLEILCNADDLTTFLKSINIIKDISRNVGDLLITIEDGKKELQEEKENLDNKLLLLDQKKVELQENLHKNKQLQQEQELYLVSLNEEREFYQEQLGNLEQMWEDCKVLFSDIVEEVTRIIGAGYFTMDDLNISFGLTKMQGFIDEETFNQMIKEKSKLTETMFWFVQDQVIIEVPKKHLILTGKFIISGESAIQFEVEEATFYDLPLDAASMEELFHNGPMLIDFKTIAGDMLLIDFTLNQVVSQDGRLAFEIKPVW